MDSIAALYSNDPEPAPDFYAHAPLLPPAPPVIQQLADELMRRASARSPFSAGWGSPGQQVLLQRNFPPAYDWSGEITLGGTPPDQRPEKEFGADMREYRRFIQNSTPGYNRYHRFNGYGPTPDAARTGNLSKVPGSGR